MRGKKALSAVVIMIVLVALTMSIAGVVITLTKKTVEKKISETESCYNILDKVSINSEYVCYNSTSDSIIFAISIGDIKIDELIVAISGEETSKIFNILSAPSEIEGLSVCGSEDLLVKLPQKKAGEMYSGDINFKPVQIKIAPIINGEACDVTDSLNNIVNCSKTTISC